MELLDILQKYYFYEEVDDAVDGLYYYLSKYDDNRSTEQIVKIVEALYNASIVFNEKKLEESTDIILDNILKGRQKDPETIRCIYELADIKIYPVYSTLRLGAP